MPSLRNRAVSRAEMHGSANGRHQENIRFAIKSLVKAKLANHMRFRRASYVLPAMPALRQWLRIGFAAGDLVLLHRDLGEGPLMNWYEGETAYQSKASHDVERVLYPDHISQ
jgi:hypothetical protein